MDALYNKEILRLAAGLSRLERLENPGATVTKTSRICGSRITVDVAFEDGVVADYAHEVKACALGQASAAIVAEHVIGKGIDEIDAVGRAVEKLLKENGDPPEGEWADFGVFVPARAHKSRHSAILLPFEALREAFSAKLKKAAAKAG